MSVNAQTNTDMSVATTPINDDYEWIQYNERLRIIHSIKDDMYQMQSIVSACNSNKQIRHWFDNQSTKELLDEMQNFINNGSMGILPDDKTHENASAGIPADRNINNNASGRILPDDKIYENRPNLPIELRSRCI